MYLSALLHWPNCSVFHIETSSEKMSSERRGVKVREQAEGCQTEPSDRKWNQSAHTHTQG